MLGLGTLAKSVFGTPNDRKVKATRTIVDKINALEPEYEALSDEGIIAKTRELQERAKGAFRGFAAVGKSFGQNIVQFLAFGDAFLEFFCFSDQAVVGQGLELGLESVDLCDQRRCRLDLAVIGSPKDLFRNCSKSEHSKSLFAPL